jgi:hypothetical protein
MSLKFAKSRNIQATIVQMREAMKCYLGYSFVINYINKNNTLVDQK